MNRRFVIDRLLHHSNNFTSCLTPNALFYLLLSDENNPTEVIQLLQARGFTDTTVVLSRNARNERLLVLRSIYTQSSSQRFK